jgi:hypothetical protein
LRWLIQGLSKLLEEVCGSGQKAIFSRFVLRTSPQASAERWPLRGVCLLASALRTGSEGVPLSNTDRASRDDPLMR